MNNPTKYLALALCSLTLVACGGGGGGGLAVPDPLVPQPLSTAPPPPTVLASVAADDLKGYEGQWKQACVDHKQITTTLVFVEPRVFTATPRKEYFENAGCTGAVIAVGTYDTFREKVSVAMASQDASVDGVSGANGAKRQLSVMPADSTISKTSYLLFNESGSAVTIDNSIPNIPVTYINYPDGSKEVFLPDPSFDAYNTTGALLIENSEFLTLNVVSDDPAAYIVNQRFYR